LDGFPPNLPGVYILWYDSGVDRFRLYSLPMNFMEDKNLQADLPDFRGLPVTVMGLGRHGGGLAAVRWLVEQGARVTVSDASPAERLTDSIRAIEDLPLVGCRFGGHDAADFRDAQLIVPNPGVRHDNPFLQEATERGIPCIGEIELFIRNCNAPIVAITGSNGKSTTAAMTAELIRAAGRRVFLGGNIGVSLLPRLAEISPDDRVVLELSSFQLYHMRADWPGVDVAAVTSFTPNHLDWHDTMSHYRAAKQRILQAGGGDSDRPAVVLPTWDEEVDRWGKSLAAGRCPIVDSPELPEMPAARGPHNRRNARLALSIYFALARHCGESPPDCNICQQALRDFAGLPMRLQLIAERDDRQFVNDSTATTPQSVAEAVGALASLRRPLWVLIGGKNKGLDFRPLFRLMLSGESLVHGVVFYGVCGPNLFSDYQAVRKELREEVAQEARQVETLDQALCFAAESSQRGDTIVLSPGCAATDQFVNYAARGRHFDRLVGEIFA